MPDATETQMPGKTGPKPLAPADKATKETIRLRPFESEFVHRYLDGVRSKLPLMTRGAAALYTEPPETLALRQIAGIVQRADQYNRVPNELEVRQITKAVCAGLGIDLGDVLL